MKSRRAWDEMRTEGGEEDDMKGSARQVSHEASDLAVPEERGVILNEVRTATPSSEETHTHRTLGI